MNMPTYVLLASILFSASALYADAIVLWEKRIGAEGEDGAPIITHEVPAGVVQYATISATCREGCTADILLDGVPEITELDQDTAKSATLKLASDGEREEFALKLICTDYAAPCYADITVSILTVPIVQPTNKGRRGLQDE